MATPTENRTPNRSRNKNRSGERSAFSWGRSNAGTIAAAAAAGAAIALAANASRKLITLGFPTSPGSWDESLAAEHDAALAVLDKMLETDSGETFKRTMLLKKLAHALDVHTHEEEHVVYPALREAQQGRDVEQLEHEHGDVKTFLYKLNEMPADSPDWIETVRKLRTEIERHARMEENEVFPRFKKEMTEEQNSKLTARMKRDAFWMA